MTVTARLRPEAEQRVPASIAVVSGQALEDEGRFSLGALDSRVANLQLGDLNGTPTVFLRGVGGGGRQVGFEPRTGFYIDGVFMNEPPLADALLLDLDRVEVLRGPQGSLFGQNTDSGAISLITRAPGERPSAQGLMRFDDRGGTRSGLAADVPLIPHRLLLRLSGNAAQSDGLTTNVFDGGKPDAYKDGSGRLRMQWLIADRLTADFTADAASHFSQFPTGEALSNPTGTRPSPLPAYSVDINTRQRDDRRSDGLAGTLNWDAGLGHLTSITSWRESKRHWLADLDYSPLDAAKIDYLDRYQRWSQELRLSNRDQGARLTWIVGVYAFRQISDSDRPTIDDSQIGVFIPQLQPGDVIRVIARMDTRSYAAFGSLGYALCPGLRLDAGWRLVTADRHLGYTQQDTPDYQKLGYTNINDYQARGSDKAALPDLALSWDLTPAVTSYARYARGSKSGGFNADVLSGGRTVPDAFSEETVNTYEVGLKSGWLRNRLRANLALFRSDYRDYQVSQFVPAGNLVLPTISNAGKLRTYGPELELLAHPYPGLTLRSSAAWLHADYVAFLNGGGAGVNYSGNRSEYAPRWTADSAIEYRQPLNFGPVAGVQAAVNYAWRTDFYTAPSNLTPYLAGPRYLLGARVGVYDAHHRVTLTIYGDNLLNDLYFDTLNRGTLGTYYGRYGAPRTFGAQLQINFDDFE